MTSGISKNFSDNVRTILESLKIYVEHAFDLTEVNSPIETTKDLLSTVLGTAIYIAPVSSQVVSLFDLSRNPSNYQRGSHIIAVPDFKRAGIQKAFIAPNVIVG